MITFVSSESNGSPVVSIVLPTYNRAHFLPEAIDSVLAQTFRDFELIVVDDGSTDNTESVVKAYNDPRIIYKKQDNKGRSNARNHALQLARGSYIAFLDSDDRYTPEKLALQTNLLDNNPAINFIYTSAYCTDENGVLLPNYYEAAISGSIYEKIAFFLPITITLPTVMMRRIQFTIAGNFDEAMHRFEDTDMWRRLSKVTAFHAMPEFTCYLRTHKQNVFSTQDPIDISESLAYYAAKVRREDASMGQWLLRRGLASLYWHYAVAFFRMPRGKYYAFRFLCTSLAYWPFHGLVQIIRKLRS